jgi:hypothetical protein
MALTSNRAKPTGASKLGALQLWQKRLMVISKMPRSVSGAGENWAGCRGGELGW